MLITFVMGLGAYGFNSKLLAAKLMQLKRPAEVYITHPKPGREQTIMEEITLCAGNDHQPMLPEDKSLFQQHGLVEEGLVFRL